MGVNNYRWFLLFLFIHILICAYGSIAGLLIFLGEKDEIMKNGGVFYNTKTGEKIAYSTRLHIKYFIRNQERMFSVVVVICFAMAIVLTGFLAYHLRMAVNNQTTNENYKFDDCQYGVDKEIKILKQLL